MESFAAFHVTPVANRPEIERLGLMCRASLKEGRFQDIADADLKADLTKTLAMPGLDRDGALITLPIVLAEFVPFHFVKPLGRDEIMPSDVFVWRKQGLKLDACVLKADALGRADHVVCLGHWNASWFDGPILLPDIATFVKYLKAPELIPEAAKARFPHLETFFASDIPNILQGRVASYLLGPGNRYRHLLNSCVLVRTKVKPKSLRILPLGSLDLAIADKELTFKV